MHITAREGEMCTSQKEKERCAHHSKRRRDVHITAREGEMCTSQQEKERCAHHSKRRRDVHIAAREGEMCTSSSQPLDEPYVLTSHSDCWMHVLANLLGNPYLCIVLSSHMKKLESGYRMHHCHHHEGPASSCLARKPTLDKSFSTCLLPAPFLRCEQN